MRKTLRQITKEVLQECCMCDLMKSTQQDTSDIKTSYSEPFDYNKLNHPDYQRQTFNKNTNATYNNNSYSLVNNTEYYDNGGHTYGEDSSYGDSQGAFNSNKSINIGKQDNGCGHSDCQYHDTCQHDKIDNKGLPSLSDILNDML